MTIRERILADENIKGQCYFCGKPVGSECYCYGCNQYVCFDCDAGCTFGEHTIADHKGLQWLVDIIEEFHANYDTQDACRVALNIDKHYEEGK